MSELVSALPGVIGAGTYGAGYAINLFAQRVRDQREGSVIESLGPIEGMPPTEPIPTTLRQRVSRAISPVAIAGAFAGGLFLPAWFSTDHAPKSANPTLEFVADLSGQGGWGSAGIAAEAAVMERFANDKKMNINVVVARGGSDVNDGNKISLQDVLTNPSYIPIGSTSLNLATSDAIGDAAHYSTNAESNVIGARESATSAVLVMTDDGPLPDVQQLINTAKSNGEHVYVVNVGNPTSPNAPVLAQLASQTGGLYVSANSNPTEAAAHLESSINPIGIPGQNVNGSEFQSWLKAADIIAGLTVGFAGADAAVIHHRRKQV